MSRVDYCTFHRRSLHSEVAMETMSTSPVSRVIPSVVSSSSLSFAVTSTRDLASSAVVRAVAIT